MSEAQTVRDIADGRLIRSRYRSYLPGGTASGEEILGHILESALPHKTPLVDVKPKRLKIRGRARLNYGYS